MITPKLVIVMLLCSVSLASNIKESLIAGTSLTALPSTKLTLDYTSPGAGKILTFKVEHKIASALPKYSGRHVICCTTAVSDPTASADLLNKCFSAEAFCLASATCSTSTEADLSLRSGTLSSNTVNVAMMGYAPVTKVDNGLTLGYTYQTTEAETKALGIPTVVSPSYTVTTKCYYRDRSTGYNGMNTGNIDISTFTVLGASTETNTPAPSSATSFGLALVQQVWTLGCLFTLVSVLSCFA
jgi:hypothetical protein